MGNRNFTNVWVLDDPINQTQTQIFDIRHCDIQYTIILGCDIWDKIYGMFFLRYIYVEHPIGGVGVWWHPKSGDVIYEWSLSENIETQIRAGAY